VSRLVGSEMCIRDRNLPAFVSDAVSIVSTNMVISMLGLGPNLTRVYNKSIQPSKTAPVYNNTELPFTGMLFVAGYSYKFRQVLDSTDTRTADCLYSTGYDTGVKVPGTWTQSLNCTATSAVSQSIIPLPVSSKIPAGSFLIGENSQGVFLMANKVNNANGTINSNVSWQVLTQSIWNNTSEMVGTAPNYALAQFAWMAAPAADSTDPAAPLVLKSVAYPGQCFTYDKSNGHIEACTGAKGYLSGQALTYSTYENNWATWLGGNNKGSLLGPF
jgi:hypothetical protein